jgi:hypothetical protein
MAAFMLVWELEAEVLVSFVLLCAVLYVGVLFAVNHGFS